MSFFDILQAQKSRPISEKDGLSRGIPMNQCSMFAFVVLCDNAV